MLYLKTRKVWCDAQWPPLLILEAGTLVNHINQLDSRVDDTQIPRKIFSRDGKKVDEAVTIMSMFPRKVPNIQIDDKPLTVMSPNRRWSCSVPVGN